MMRRELDFDRNAFSNAALGCLVGGDRCSHRRRREYQYKIIKTLIRVGALAGMHVRSVVGVIFEHHE